MVGRWVLGEVVIVEATLAGVECLGGECWPLIGGMQRHSFLWFLFRI
jgi:hypothetical protein